MKKIVGLFTALLLLFTGHVALSSEQNQGEDTADHAKTKKHTHQKKKRKKKNKSGEKGAIKKMKREDFDALLARFQQEKADLRKKIAEQQHEITTLKNNPAAGETTPASQAQVQAQAPATAGEAPVAATSAEVDAALSQEVKRLRHEVVLMKKITTRLGIMEPFNAEHYGVNQAGEAYLKGLTFRVQIGAYKKLNVDELNQAGSHRSGNIEQEKRDVLHRYTGRIFRNYLEADKFKKIIQAMGLKDAFIAPFMDDQPVTFQDKAVLAQIAKERRKK